MNTQVDQWKTRFPDIHAFAIEVLGDADKAQHWLDSRPPVFQGRSPAELLETEQGADLVETVLGRIAYGIYS